MKRGRMSCLEMVLLVAGIFCILQPVSGSSILTSNFSKTLTLTGVGSLNYTANLSVPAQATISSASLEVETPEATLPAMDDPTLNIGGQSAVWGWPGNFGSSSGFSSGPALIANNTVTEGSLMFPKGGNISGGSAELTTPGEPLGGNYSLTLKAGQFTVFSQNSSELFSGFSTLPWVAPGSVITAISDGANPNGSFTMGIGTSAGSLIVYSGEPGSMGEPVYQAELSANYPITAMTVAPLFQYAPATVIASSPGLVYVLNLTAGGNWKETSLLLPEDPSNVVAVVRELAVARSPAGSPFILAMTAGGNLDISSFGSGGPAGGWSNPMSTLLASPWGGETSFSEWDSPEGVTKLAVGNSNQIELFNYSGSTPILTHNLTLTSGAVASLQFDPSGSSLIVGTSLGTLLQYQSPWTSASLSSLNLSGGSVLAIAFGENQTNHTPMVVLTSSQEVFDVDRQAGALKGDRVVGSFNVALNLGGIGLGPLLGFGDNDLYVASGSSVFVARDTTFFRGTSLGEWATDIESALSGSPVSSDAYGNQWISVPVTLSVRGGVVEVEYSSVSYNYTRVIDVTSLIRTAFAGNTGPSVPLPISLSATSPGTMHVQLSVFVALPSSSITSWSNELVSGLFRVSPWIAMAAIVAGGSLLGLGIAKYGRRRWGGSHPTFNHELAHPNEKATLVGRRESDYIPRIR